MVPILNEFRESKYSDKQCPSKQLPWFPACLFQYYCSQHLQTTLGKCLQSQCPSHTKTAAAVASSLFGRSVSRHYNTSNLLYCLVIATAQKPPNAHLSPLLQFVFQDPLEHLITQLLKSQYLDLGQCPPGPCSSDICFDWSLSWHTFC